MALELLTPFVTVASSPPVVGRLLILNPHLVLWDLHLAYQTWGSLSFSEFDALSVRLANWSSTSKDL